MTRYCPKCGDAMTCLGNIDGTVILTNPPRWHEVFVCELCKVKVKVLCSGHSNQPVDLADYAVVDLTERN